MGGRLSKPDAGIEHDPFAGDAASHECLHSFFEKLQHLGNDIIVVRFLLHGLRRSLHVHQDHTAIAVRADMRHVCIEHASGDVVNDLCPGDQCFCGHAGFHRVDGDRDLELSSQSVNDWDHATQLLRLVDRLCARSC